MGGKVASIYNMLWKATDNILYKILKVEQAGEHLHQKWNMLDQTRFFAVRNGCDKLLYTFMEYENNLYLKK